MTIQFPLDQIIRTDDLDQSDFDVTNGDGSNKIKLRNRITGTAPAATLLKVTDLDRDITSGAFTPFYGVIDRLQGEEVANLPQYLRYPVLHSVKTTKLEPEEANLKLKVTGYQMTVKGQIIQRVSVGGHVWVRTNSGGTWTDETTVSNHHNSWKNWERDTTPEFLKLVSKYNIDINTLEFNNLLSVRNASDEYDYRNDYGLFHSLDNLLVVNSKTNRPFAKPFTENTKKQGLYSGFKGNEKFHVVYVDNTHNTGSDGDENRGSKENPYNSLDFLRYINSLTRTMVFLKSTGQPYVLTNGRGREAESTGVRVFTTYNGNMYDDAFERYKENPTFSGKDVQAFTDFPRATIKFQLYEYDTDPDNRPLLMSPFQATNGGIYIFDNIDFECTPDPVGKNTRRGTNNRIWGSFTLNGGSMVFNHCKFSISAESAQADNGLVVVPFKSRNSYGKPNGYVFNGCTFDLARELPSTYRLLNSRVGDSIIVNDSTLARQNVPTEYQSKSIIQGNAKTTLANRVTIDVENPIITQGYSLQINTNFPLEVVYE